MKALVIGATGAVGKDLVQQLIDDSSVERVDIFVRREVRIPSAKLVAHVVDFDHPETWADQLQSDVLFSCMGTTIKAAGTQEAQWKVDYTYQYEAAKAAKVNGVPTYVLVSAIGLLRTWTPMPTEAVAAAMISLAKSGRKGVEIIESQDILKVHNSSI